MQWLDKLLKFLQLRAVDPEEEIDGSDNELLFAEEDESDHNRDLFLHSLNDLKPENIPLSYIKPKKNAADKVQYLIQNLALAVCIVVFAVSCFMLADNFLQKIKGAELYDEAADEFAQAGLDFGFGDEVGAQLQLTGGVDRLSVGRKDNVISSLSVRIDASEEGNVSSSGSDSTYNAQLEKLRALLRSYKERNEDVYGYLSIPSVGIEYVVVQGEDNDYYLDHNYKKEYLVIGSIFVDYRCNDVLMRNYNTILYGHNIQSSGPGNMFHNITEFFDEEKFREGLIYFYTMDGVFIYKPFSIYDTTSSSGYIRTGFTSGTDFINFAEAMKARSRIPSDVTFSSSDRIITFSTCTNLTSNGRYAMHAVLIDMIT